MGFQQNCIVCGSRVVFPAPPGEDIVCARAECRFVVNEKQKMPAVAYTHFFARFSQQIRERVQQQKKQQELLKQTEQREAAENRLYWQTRTAKIPDYQANKFPLLAIPHNARRIINLSERRKRAFRDHLNKRISSVMEHPDVVHTEQALPEPPSSNYELFDRICTLCRGACCLAGSDHAYIKDNTLVRVMRSQPSLRPRHLLELYLSYLGRKTVENACIYLGETGCMLPPELRSNVCLDYYCPSLRSLKWQVSENKALEGAFVVVRAREHWTFPKGSENGIASAFLLTKSGDQAIE